MTEDKRPTSNIRVYEETIEAMRKEQRRQKDLNNEEPTYAELTEEAWTLREREQSKHGATPFTITNYLRSNLAWHNQLEVILNSNVDIIAEAIQKNLIGFERAVHAIKERWEKAGDPPSEEERELIDTVVGILRTDDTRSLRRELLLALLKETRRKKLR